MLLLEGQSERGVDVGVAAEEEVVDVDGEVGVDIAAAVADEDGDGELDGVSSCCSFSCFVSFFRKNHVLCVRGC